MIPCTLGLPGVVLASWTFWVPFRAVIMPWILTVVTVRSKPSTIMAGSGNTRRTNDNLAVAGKSLGEKVQASRGEDMVLDSSVAKWPRIVEDVGKHSLLLLENSSVAAGRLFLRRSEGMMRRVRTDWNPQGNLMRQVPRKGTGWCRSTRTNQALTKETTLNGGVGNSPES